MSSPTRRAPPLAKVMSRLPAKLAPRRIHFHQGEVVLEAEENRLGDIQQADAVHELEHVPDPLGHGELVVVDVPVKVQDPRGPGLG
jgi:hypothetical protein